MPSIGTTGWEFVRKNEDAQAIDAAHMAAGAELAGMGFRFRARILGRRAWPHGCTARVVATAPRFSTSPATLRASPCCGTGRIGASRETGMTVPCSQGAVSRLFAMRPPTPRAGHPAPAAPRLACLHRGGRGLGGNLRAEVGNSPTNADESLHKDNAAAVAAQIGRLERNV